MTSLERKQRYYQRKNNGVCVKCGKADSRTQAGFIHCKPCQEKQKGWVMNYTPKESTLQKMQESMQDRYWRLKEQNRCTDCGNQDQRTLQGKIYCEKCATKRNNEQKRQRRVGWQL